MTDFFTAPGRFYRGNLHTHSTLSDGLLEPAEVCRRYKAEGYDFIALTDHFLGMYDFPIADTVPFRDGGFTTILGAELHSGAQVERRVVAYSGGRPAGGFRTAEGRSSLSLMRIRKPGRRSRQRARRRRRLCRGRASALVGPDAGRRAVAGGGACGGDL